MMIGGSTALVTGANRGLGKALVRALLEAGCAKVYAAARNVAGVAPDRVVQPVPARYHEYRSGRRSRGAVR